MFVTDILHPLKVFSYFTPKRPACRSDSEDSEDEDEDEDEDERVDENIGGRPEDTFNRQHDKVIRGGSGVAGNFDDEVVSISTVSTDRCSGDSTRPNLALRMLSPGIGSGCSISGDSRGASFDQLSPACNRKNPCGNASLMALDLSCNNISQGAAKALVQLVYRNKSITDLSLSDNNLPEECGKDLRFAIEENSTLHFLRLHGNPSIRKQDRRVIEKKLKKVRSRWMQRTTRLYARRESETLEEEEESIKQKSSGLSIALQDNNSEVTNERGKLGSDRSQIPQPRLKAGGVFDETVLLADDKGMKNANKQDEMPDTSERGRVKMENKGANPTPLEEKADSLKRDSGASETKQRPTIGVLFSAPLAYVNPRTQQLHEMETLDFEHERDLLWHSFRKASRDIFVRIEYATTET